MENSSQRQFLLISTQRAGTHMVRSTIDQHPDVCCYGEMINLKRRRWYPETTEMSFAQLEEWMSGQTQKRWWGYAVHIFSWGKTNQLLRQFWKSHSLPADLPIIYVFRRNLLRQTLSQYRAIQASKAAGRIGWMSYRSDSADHARFGSNKSGIGELRKIRVNCRTFHRRIVEWEANESMFLARMQFFNVCPVAYEDFVADSSAELKRMFDFLDVDFLPLSPQTECTGPGLLTDLIENFEEFASYFAATPYATFLQDLEA